MRGNEKLRHAAALGRKATPEEVRTLAERFRALGVCDPEVWARSEIEDECPHYARLVFLRAVWKNVIPEGDTAWIDQLVQDAKRRPRDPGAGAGPALKRALACGVAKEDLAEIVRVMQWDTLTGIVSELSDPPTVAEFPSDDLPRVTKWSLFEVDDDGTPLHPLEMLQEAVLAMEPSGREMRPRGVGRGG